MYKSMLAGAMFLGTVGAAPAMAACTTTDMVGRWDLYALGANSAATALSTLRCSLTVAATTGAVTGTCNNLANQTLTAFGGALASRTTCRVAGFFNTPPEPGVTTAPVQNIIQQATMSNDKATVAGHLVIVRAATPPFPAPPPPVVLLFQAVRR